MKLQHKLSAVVLAVAAALPLALTTPVLAQNYATLPTATVQAFGVEQVRSIVPGSELVFSLQGTPGAEVTLQMAGATGDVRMTEVGPGSYQGSYTVRTRDRLTASSLVTARVLKDGGALNVSMDQSLVRGARSPVPVATARIAAFTVAAPERIRAGDELRFSMTGAPGGKAHASVTGIAERIPMPEIRRGLYETTYTARRQDRLRGDLVATGHLVLNQQETSQRFERPRADGAGRRDRRGDERAAQACAMCGVVESVNVVEIKDGSVNVLGTIVGGVLGGVLGNQVGGGSGKDIATILGAVGGAYAGNRVENNAKKAIEYRVVVRLDSGDTQTFAYATEPTIETGARVRIENGALQRE